MARIDKEGEARLQGMEYALRYAKDKGLDELAKEVRRRGYCKLPIKFSDTQIINTVREIAENTYVMMMTAFLYALHDEFGFGPVRLKRVKSAASKLVDNVFDLDYMGEHYIDMGDYAEELCEKYGPIVDLVKVRHLQETFDRKDENRRVCQVDRVIEELRSAGFDEAAELINRKVS